MREATAWKRESACTHTHKNPMQPASHHCFESSALPHTQPHCTANTGTNNVPYPCSVMKSTMLLQNQYHNANPAHTRGSFQSGGTSQHSPSESAQPLTAAALPTSSAKTSPRSFTNRTSPLPMHTHVSIANGTNRKAACPGTLIGYLVFILEASGRKAGLPSMWVRSTCHVQCGHSYAPVRHTMTNICMPACMPNVQAKCATGVVCARKREGAREPEHIVSAR